MILSHFTSSKLFSLVTPRTRTDGEGGISNIGEQVSFNDGCLGSLKNDMGHTVIGVNVP